MLTGSCIVLILMLKVEKVQTHSVVCGELPYFLKCFKTDKYGPFLTVDGHQMSRKFLKDGEHL